jgi:hypothetical protein
MAAGRAAFKFSVTSQAGPGRPRPRRRGRAVRVPAAWHRARDDSVATVTPGPSHGPGHLRVRVDLTTRPGPHGHVPGARALSTQAELELDL